MEKMIEDLLNEFKLQKDFKNQLSEELDLLNEMVCNIIKYKCLAVIINNNVCNNKKEINDLLNNKLNSLKSINTNSFAFDYMTSVQLAKTCEDTINEINIIIKRMNDIDNNDVVKEILEKFDFNLERIKIIFDEYEKHCISMLSGVKYFGKPIVKNNEIDSNVIEELFSYIKCNPMILKEREEVQTYLKNNYEYERLAFLCKNARIVITKKLFENMKKIVRKYEKRIILRITSAHLLSPLKKYGLYVILDGNKKYLNLDGLLDALGNKKFSSKVLNDFKNDVVNFSTFSKRISSMDINVNELQYLIDIFETTNYSKNCSFDIRGYSDEQVTFIISDESEKLKKELEERMKVLTIKFINDNEKKIEVIRNFPIEVNGDSSLVVKSGFMISTKFNYTCGLKLVRAYDTPNLSDACEAMDILYPGECEKCISQTNIIQQRLYGVNPDSLSSLPKSPCKRLQKK